FLVDAVELGLQTRVAVGVVKVKRKIADVLDELVELRIVLLRVAEFDDAFAHVCGELVAQRPPRHAHNGKLLGQQVGLAQVEERRQQLALGQVAGGAEDHQNSRLRNSLSTLGHLRKILRPYLHRYRRHDFLLNSSSQLPVLSSQSL